MYVQVQSSEKVDKLRSEACTLCLADVSIYAVSEKQNYLYLYGCSCILTEEYFAKWKEAYYT